MSYSSGKRKKKKKNERYHYENGFFNFLVGQVIPLRTHTGKGVYDTSLTRLINHDSSRLGRERVEGVEVHAPRISIAQAAFKTPDEVILGARRCFTSMREFLRVGVRSRRLKKKRGAFVREEGTRSFKDKRTREGKRERVCRRWRPSARRDFNDVVRRV